LDEEEFSGVIRKCRDEDGLLLVSAEGPGADIDIRKSRSVNCECSSPPLLLALSSPRSLADSLRSTMEAAWGVRPVKSRPERYTELRREYAQ